MSGRDTEGHRMQPLHAEPRRFARVLTASSVAGGLVGALLWLGDTRSSLTAGVLLAAWVGLWMGLASDFLLTLLARPLSRLRGGTQAIGFAAMLFLAGLLGWQLAAWTTPWVTLGRWRIGGFSPTLLVAFAGSVATVVGLLLLGYERLRDRLTDSVARLKEHEFAERELESAREIQRRLLPPARFAGDGFVVVARNEAARVVAGDFYDIFPLAGGSIAVAVGDVAGKGMAASLLMASVKAMLPLLGFERGLGAAFRDLNDRLFAQLESRQFVALAVACFDPRSGELRLANAGLPDPYRLSTEGVAQGLIVPGPRLPLGACQGIAYQELRSVLAPGERLLLLTDGLPEAQESDGEPLGYARFEELLAGLAAEPAAAIDQIFAGVAAESPPPLSDDATLLLVERARKAADS